MIKPVLITFIFVIKPLTKKDTFAYQKQSDVNKYKRQLWHFVKDFKKIIMILNK
jgi:hypothetical protein